MPKFTVVTACRNAASYLEETIRSVLAQPLFRSGACELEYLVCDGASTDGSLELLRRYEAQGLQVVSEPDRGFYDALAKGLERASGDYVAYLNAGDVLLPGGLSAAFDCLQLPGVRWITGYAANCNERSQVVACSLPLRFRRNLFDCGAYGTALPFLSQESTAWRRELHAAVDFHRLGVLKLAGDAYLWKCFASEAELYVVRALIGAFRVHRGQLSERRAEYGAELRSISRAPDFGERLRCLADRALWSVPENIKTFLNPRTRIVFDYARDAWVVGGVQRASGTPDS